MPAVDSSAIAWVDYDAAARVLSITFHTTGTYEYVDVPVSVYNALLSSPSKGEYFNEHIRDRYSDMRSPALRRSGRASG